MSDIARRLEVLKSYYADELKQSNPSKGYLDDLQESIAYCEGLLQKGYTMIHNPWPATIEEEKLQLQNIVK